MFKYKVNSRLIPQLRLLNYERQGSFSVELSAHADVEDPQSPGTPKFFPGEEEDDDLVEFPLFRTSSSRRKKRPSSTRHSVKPCPEPPCPEPVQEDILLKPGLTPEDISPDGNLNINIELDFGFIFGWLERFIWATMFLSVAWALIYNFERATSEYCLPFDNSTQFTPFNILPSLSRSMSSFRVGKFIWTITMAGVFVARLLSNWFLHRLYETWYEDSIFNKAYLGLAYLLDTLEIISLVMIPAFSLDCDPGEHSVFFRVFICLTFSAEVLQYLTKFLKRKAGLVLRWRDVSNYYRQIGILIILQTLFIGFMMTGYILHEQLCGDYYYSIFTLGEYITVVINVRFKRDTVLFVK